MKSESFDRFKLSMRENEILDFAIEGMTDIQISQALEISQSTVNSYWVRIRGKVGQLSRTELVANALKQKAKGDMDVALARILDFEERAKTHEKITDDFRQAESYHAALDAMPEAMLYLCEKSIIRYSNDRLDAMFGYGSGDLIGKPLRLLLPPRLRDADGAVVEASAKGGEPTRLGIERVCYGRRYDGTEFRIILLLDSRSTSTGLISSIIVRDFLTEIDTRRGYLGAERRG